MRFLTKTCSPVCLRPAAKPSTIPFLPLTQTANLSQKEKKRLMKQEPYRWAQIQQRKAVHVKKQEELQRSRDAGWGDQIHGKPTPFVASFDTAGQANRTPPMTDGNGVPIGEPHDLPTSPEILNHLLSRSELEEAIATSYQLAEPVENPNSTLIDPVAQEKEQQEYQENHRKAVIALQRITALENGSSKDRLHANIRRCIETFGRHNTDQTLRPRPRGPAGQQQAAQPVARAGPDTGSSEVQIAILTAKIRALSKALDAPKGQKDKHNKRNLRNLCHRRQRLLKYMEKKEKGSERWTHMLETLGLTPATWQQQISF